VKIDSTALLRSLQRDLNIGLSNSEREALVEYLKSL
jgi:hypothetical protein